MGNGLPVWEKKIRGDLAQLASSLWSPHLCVSAFPVDMPTAGGNMLGGPSHQQSLGRS